jgi:GT2 family glycosyltransferase
VTRVPRRRSRPLTIAVIIPTYRRPERLTAALDSLVAQRRRPDQVVVCFIAHDARSRQALSAFRSRLGSDGGPFRLTVLEVEPLSLLAQENAGLEAAKSDIVCFLDDDAVAPPGWLRRIQRHFRNPEVVGVGGPDLLPDAGQRPAVPVPIGRLDPLGRLHGNHHRPFGERVLDVDFLKGCNMSFRRELVDPLDSRLIGQIPYGFEIDMGLAARSDRSRIVYDPALTVEHHSSHDMSASRAGLAFVTNHNQTYVVLKHLDWPRRLIFLAYTFVIGDRSTAGILRIAWMAWRERWPVDTCIAHLSGKWGGVVSFLRWRFEPERRAAESGAGGGSPAWQ